MLLEFKLYEVKESSNLYKLTCAEDSSKNTFIIVGEENERYFQVQQIDEKGLGLISGLKINQAAFIVKKEDIKLKSGGFGYESVELDIPKEYLTLDIIEGIIRLNEREGD
jgi:hypothetical protein